MYSAVLSDKVYTHTKTADHFLMFWSSEAGPNAHYCANKKKKYYIIYKVISGRRWMRWWEEIIEMDGHSFNKKMKQQTLVFFYIYYKFYSLTEPQLHCCHSISFQASLILVSRGFWGWVHVTCYVYLTRENWDRWWTITIKWNANDKFCKVKKNCEWTPLS